jgi:hypothetical protein
MKIKHISRHQYLIYVYNGISDSLKHFLSPFQVKTHVWPLRSFTWFYVDWIKSVNSNAITPSVYKVRGMKAKWGSRVRSSPKLLNGYQFDVHTLC